MSSLHGTGSIGQLTKVGLTLQEIIQAKPALVVTNAVTMIYDPAPYDERKRSLFATMYGKKLETGPNYNSELVHYSPRTEIMIPQNAIIRNSEDGVIVHWIAENVWQGACAYCQQCICRQAVIYRAHKQDVIATHLSFRDINVSSVYIEMFKALQTTGFPTLELEMVLGCKQWSRNKWQGLKTATSDTNGVARVLDFQCEEFYNFLISLFTKDSPIVRAWNIATSENQFAR